MTKQKQFLALLAGGILAFGGMASADDITITVSTNVLRTGVIRSGLNYGAGHNRLTMSENFEGTMYRQALSGTLYTNSFLVLTSNPFDTENSGWDDVYVGGDYRIASDPVRGLTGTIVHVTNVWVDVWGNSPEHNIETNPYPRHSNRWTFATGSVVFAGDIGSTVPAGTRLLDTHALEYVVDTEFTLASTSEIHAVTAGEWGSNWNTTVGTELTFYTNKTIKVPIGMASNATVSAGGITGGVSLNVHYKYRNVLVLDQPMPGTSTKGVRGLTLQFERMSDHEGLLVRENWWRSGTCSIVATNTPGLFGQSALGMDGTESDAFFRLDSFGSSEIDVNSDWQCSFWVKAVSGTPNVSFDYRANTGDQLTNFTPTASWEKKVVDFSTTGITNDSLVAEIFVSGGEVLIDNVAYELMGHTNATAYTDDFVDAMKAFRPGLLRGTLDMGGYAVTNRIGPRSGWLRGFFRTDVGVGPLIPNESFGAGRGSFHDQLTMYEEIGAEPWLSISGTSYTNEIIAFVEWLAGPTNTPWGKIRADLGHPEPWTDVFDQITVEYGNEAWNTFAPFNGGGSSGSNYWHDLTAAAKASPWFTSNISITVGGQASSAASQDTLMYEKNTNADAFCSAPYVMDSYYTNDLAMLTNITQEFEYFLSYPLWKTYEDLAIRHARVLSDTNTFEYKFYEYNYHTTHGDAGLSNVAERVAAFNGSRAHGISMINYSLLCLKDFGVNRQCLFKAQRNDGSGVASLVKLWSVIPSFKKGAMRGRPVWWAFQAVNQVRQGDLLETVHSADPTFTALGNYSTKRPDGVDVLYTVRTNDSVYSYAFRDGNTNGLVLINYDLDTTQNVTLALSDYVLNDEAVSWELVSDSYTNHNDEEGFFDAVSLLETNVSEFVSGITVELPPCNLKVYQWVADGVLPAIWVSTQNVPVAEGGTGNFDVSLSLQPRATTTVTVQRLSGDTNITVQSGAELVFTTIDWSTPQPVTLEASEDDDANNSPATIGLSSSGTHAAELTATEVEDDLGVELSTDILDVAEEGTAGYQVRLSLQPLNTMTVMTARVSGDTDVSVTEGTNLVFTTTDWNVYRDVTLSAVADDDLTNGLVVVQSSASGIISADLTATLLDNDSQSISRPSTLLVPEGTTNTFAVTLSNIPIAPRTVTVARVSGETNIVIIGSSNLVFDSGTWNVEQYVSVAANQDSNDADSNATVRCTSTGLLDRDITVTSVDDDDFTPPTVTEAVAQSSSSILVVFSEPLDITSAETLGNYTLNQGGSVLSATFDSVTSNRVILLTSQLTEALEYTLVVDGVEDLSSNAVANSSNSVIYYLYKLALFDLGEAATPTVGNWNNVTTNTLGVQIADAINTDGESSGISFEISDAFSDISGSGTVASNLYPSTAQRDSLVVERYFPGELTLSNLNPLKPQRLVFFGSRKDLKRSTTYAVGDQSVTLDNKNNVDGSVSLQSVYPDSNGEITVQVSGADNALTGYLGVMELHYTPAAALETSVSSLDVPEDGTNTFGVRFTSNPNSIRTVIVARASGDTNLIVTAGTNLVFTTNDWMNYKTVTILAEDDDDWISSNAIILCSSATMADKYVTANEVENDTDPDLTLPFSETFENTGDFAGTLGTLDGQHGWTADAGAVVTNSDAQGGSQSLSIAGASVSHSFLGTPNNIQITFWANPVRSDIPETITGEASAVFYVNTNDNLVAYSNTTAIALDTTVVSNGWNKFVIQCDYVSNVWKLELNDQLVVSNFAFHGTPASFSDLELKSSSAGPFFIDSITLSAEFDPSDSDSDGLPDAWEQLYFGGLSPNPGDGASNGINTVLQAYIAGLDPTDPLARFEVSDLQNDVLFWNGVSGRVYTVYWTSNLLSGFQTLETNVSWTGSVFTDSTHSAEGQGFYKIDVRINE